MAFRASFAFSAIERTSAAFSPPANLDKAFKESSSLNNLTLRKNCGSCCKASSISACHLGLLNDAVISATLALGGAFLSAASTSGRSLPRDN